MSFENCDSNRRDPGQAGSLTQSGNFGVRRAFAASFGGKFHLIAQWILEQTSKQCHKQRRGNRN